MSTIFHYLNWTHYLFKLKDGILQALFLCAPFLSKMENVHLFSSSLPRFDKCHETSRIFPRTEQTFASARSFGVISGASFSRKNGPFGFGRAPSAPFKKRSQSQKCHFLEKTKLKKWHQSYWHWQKSAQSLEIFVRSCDICRGVGVSSRKGEHFSFLTKMVRTKIKPVLKV